MSGNRSSGPAVLPAKETAVTTGEKNGVFDQWKRDDRGGDKKTLAKGESGSRTGHKQNAGHGGRNP